MLRLVHYRGCIAVVGNDISNLASPYLQNVPESARANLKSRDGESSDPHITLLAPDEFNACESAFGTPEEWLLESLSIYDFGISHTKKGSDESWAVVICSPSLQEIRYKLGLSEKELHITLGFHGSDTHSISPSRLVQWLETASKSVLEAHTTHICQFTTQDRAREWKQRYPHTLAQMQILLRFVSTSLLEKVSADLSDDRALDLLKDIGRLALNVDSSLAQDVSWSLLRPTSSDQLCHAALYGLRLLFSANIIIDHGLIDTSSVIAILPLRLYPHSGLLQEDCKRLKTTLHELNTLFLTKSDAKKARAHTPQQQVISYTLEHRKRSTDVDAIVLNVSLLPRNFSYASLGPASPMSLAGSAFPSKRECIQALAAVNVGMILTIHEGPLPPDLLQTAQEYHINCQHVLVADRTPPSQQQMIETIRHMHTTLTEKHQAVLVHCQGGVGRTNTVIASYLMAVQGGNLSAAEAIKQITEQRSIMLSESQKGFLKNTWFPLARDEQDMLLSSITSNNDEPATSKGPASAVPVAAAPVSSHNSVAYYRKIAGTLQLPPVLLLCGLPASGKSTLATALTAAQPSFFKRINRDDLRALGKGGADAALSTAMRELGLSGSATKKGKGSKGPSNGILIMDGTHLTVAKRREALDSIFHAQTWCIAFDHPVSQCASRAANRHGHPTVPAGPGAAALVENIASQWQPPFKEEGFDRVVFVRSDEDMSRLLASWRIPFMPPSGSFTDDGERLPPPPMPMSGKAGAVTEETIEMLSENDATSSSSDEEGKDGMPDLSQPIKFPRTAHVLNLGAATRDDKLLPAEKLQKWINEKTHLLIEEKIDGANLGFFIRADDQRIVAQNRSHFMSSAYHPQFALLDKWVAKHAGDLYSVLQPEQEVLYGEWVYATHSVSYNALPDWFIAYDLYNIREKKFVCRAELERRLEGTSIVIAPKIMEGVITGPDHLKSMLKGTSQYTASGATREGIVIRECDEQHLLSRAKLVRPDFIAGNERWNRSAKLQTNALISAYASVG